MESPRTPPREERAPREDDGDLGLARCPFCRTGCGPDDDAVACQRCLARHHRACWDEGGACAACREPQRLEPGAPPPLDLARARQLLTAAGHPSAQVDAFLAGLAERSSNPWPWRGAQIGGPPLLAVLGVAHVLSIPWGQPQAAAGYALLLALTAFPLYTGLAAGLSRRYGWALAMPLLLGAAGGWGLRHSGWEISLAVLPYGLLGALLGLAAGCLSAFLAGRWSRPRPPAAVPAPVARPGKGASPPGE